MRLKQLFIVGSISFFNSCSEIINTELIEKHNREIILLKTELNNLKENNMLLDRNKNLVVDFYQEVFGELKSEAIHKYIGDVYTT